MKILYIIFGALIGIANIIPGFSGGTMAVILGMYDKIISAISNIKNDFKNSLKILIPIGVGAVLGIVGFAKIIEFLLEKFPIATNFVFTGLIIGSFSMIIKKTTAKRRNLSGIVAFLAGIVLMILMQLANVAENSAITQLDIASFIKIFTASLISAGAMIVPGLSGSFLLLLFGVYTTILTAISSMNILILMTVGIGCLFGILIFAKIIDKLFKSCKNETYMAILGLMVGSIWSILPKPVANIEYFIGLVLAVLVGVTTAIFAEKNS